MSSETSISSCSAGKSWWRSSRSTSDGRPRSSRSAGPRLTATLRSWPRCAQPARSPRARGRGRTRSAPASGRSARPAGGSGRGRAGRARGAPSARAPRRRARRRSAAPPSAGSAGRAGRPRARRRARRRARGAGGCGGRGPRGRPRGRCACAWPGTSRRRRAAAAPWRRGSARGRARCRRWRRCGRGCRRPRRSARARRAGAAPAVLAEASSPGWRMTANSSPPRRASVSSSRRSSLRRGPIWRSTSSPAWWPSVSLSSLKPSRSIRSSASSSSRSVRGRDRGVQRVDEVAAVAEAGEVVGAAPASGVSRRRSITVRPARAMPVSTVTVASAIATASIVVNCPTVSSVSATVAKVRIAVRTTGLNSGPGLGRRLADPRGRAHGERRRARRTTRPPPAPRGPRARAAPTSPAASG